MTLVGKAGLLTGAGNMSCLGGDVIMRGRDDVMSCDDVTMSGWAGRRGKDRSFRLIFSREDLRRVDEDAFSVEKRI